MILQVSNGCIFNLARFRLHFCVCRDFPARAVAARQTSEQQLAEAKIETAELGTELAALKLELRKVRPWQAFAQRTALYCNVQASAMDRLQSLLALRATRCSPRCVAGNRYKTD